MKNKKDIKTKINKKSIILLSSILIGTLSTVTYFKINDNLHKENIAKNEEITQDEIKSIDIDIIDVKDFKGDNTLIGENLNQFTNRGKLLNDDFLYLRRYDSSNKIDLIVVNKDKKIKNKITLITDDFENIELNSFIELYDGSLILKLEEYSINEGISMHSIKKYDINGNLDFIKEIDASHDILNLYSSIETNEFASLESDESGKAYIVKYNHKGEIIFKYNTKYDYTSNIDVILKKDKTILLSKEDDCYIVELDSNGNELRKINIPYKNIIVSKILQTSDGGYIINFVKNETSLLKNSESHTIKVNLNGEIEWSNIEKAHSFAKSISEVDDGYISFNYYYYNKDEENTDNTNILSLYSVSKIDKSGNTKWIKYLGLNKNYNEFIFTPSTEYVEGDYFIITGILEDVDNNSNHINIKVDKDGNMSKIDDINSNNDIK